MAVKFDLSNIMEQAKQEVENAKSEFKYSLLYPGEGLTRVKLMYNAKAGILMRQIHRHTTTDGKTKVPCLSMYNEECPVCKVLNTIKERTGRDVWKWQRSFRGIAFAQFLGGSNSYNNMKVGDIVIFMFPWTVYQRINEIITELGTDMEKLMATNKGYVIEIKRQRNPENNQITYEVELDRNMETSFDTDEDYFRALEELDDLNEQICPIEIDNTIIESVRSFARKLEADNLSMTSTYVSDGVENVPTKNEQVATQMSNAVNSSAPKDAPSCWGHHNDNSIDSNQCLLCPYELDCQKVK